MPFNLLASPIKLLTATLIAGAVFSVFASSNPDQQSNASTRFPKLPDSHPLAFHLKRLNSNWWIDTGYTYSDMKYKSTNQDDENRYSGASNVFSLNLWRFMKHNMMLGISYSRSHLSTSSHLQLGITNSNSYSRLNGNEFGVSLRKLWMAKFYLEGFVKYGFNENKLNETTSNTLTRLTGDVSFNGQSWLGGLATGVSYPVHNNLLLNGGLGLFYFKNYQNGYSIVYDNGTEGYHNHYVVDTLNLTQTVGLTYVLNKYLRPFSNVNLLEVVDYDENRNINQSLTVLSSNLPAFTLNDFGFSVNAGTEITIKKTLILLGYAYTRRGGSYHSHNFFVNASIPV